MPEKTEFLPFHAINEYMRPDFRLSIIRETITSQVNLQEQFIIDLNQKINKYVKIPGFRNSEKAPALMKVYPTAKAFEKNPDLVASIISCWTELNIELRDQVIQLLTSRNWKIIMHAEGLDFENLASDLLKDWPIFPVNFNRSKLPGFYIHWPKENDFDVLYDNFIALFPQAVPSIDKVSLMVVWMTMRLPYHVDAMVEQIDE